MIELNNNSMFVGQIKQILHNFNLPLCRIGDKYPYPNSVFLKQNEIWQWDSSKNPHKCIPYIYGNVYTNITGNLKIDNLIYDRETHRYLGKYLRFLRDYSNLDLMSMYNCFDQELNFDDVSFKYDKDSEQKISFMNSRKANYSCYKVPISLKNLTISTHNCTLIELCISVNNKNTGNKNQITDLAKLTYVKTKFNNLYYYNVKDIIDKILSENNDTIKTFILKNINSLELLIKLPTTLNTSVVILEGTYLNNTDDLEYFTYYDEKNKVIRESGFNIKCQLLSSENATKNYLLADRLIEYLSGNVITKLSQPYEIERIQRLLDKLRFSNSTVSKKLIQKLPENRYYGIWHDIDFMNLKTLISEYKLNQNFDTLGYFDKELEDRLRGDLDGINW